ncbi:MAG: hypothetical protein U0599_09525 [Vicinamibacteria bacterium]
MLSLQRACLFVALAIVPSGALASGPVLRIKQGNTLYFDQYKAASGLRYEADGRLAIADLSKAWADAASIVIEGTLEIRRNNPLERVKEILVSDSVTIAPGGRIVTNGNTLLIFANRFITQNGATIVAFEPTKRKAGNGEDAAGAGAAGNVSGANGGSGPTGSPGRPGESGGSVLVFTSSFNGPLSIDLSGQSGGDGGRGGPGGAGARGHKGEDAESTPAWCNRGGGKGGPGGNGGPGGQGGSGGAAGSGGDFHLFYVSSTTVNPPVNPAVVVEAGSPGAGGQGGAGGSRGEGGEGGNGQGHCHGGDGGDPGAPGSSLGGGPTGALGSKGNQTILKLNAVARIQQEFKTAVEQTKALQLPTVKVAQ